MPTNENLGPAERIIKTLLTYTDHLYHGRCGIVTPDNSVVGVKWSPATHRLENGVKTAYRLDKVGRKTIRTRVGTIRDDGKVVEGTRVVGDYRQPGLFPEVVAWTYKQIAEVWKLDNEFAARWASYAYGQDHRDFKVILAAFMLVQSRKGEPVKENDQVSFYDDDFRDVGEAMFLQLRRKENNDISPRHLLRAYDILSLSQVAEINRELGFGVSARKPFYGRWPKAVEKWLRFREENPQLLKGLIKSGYRKTVIELCRRSGYKPLSSKFFTALRWKQAQAKDGHRELAIGEKIKAAETWKGLTEEQICEKIVKDRPNYKRIVGMIPEEIGLTQAILAAAVESGCLSQKDLIILTPTLESLGLLQDTQVKSLWDEAVKNATDMRAANIAARVTSREAKEGLEKAQDIGLQSAVEKQMDNVRLYFCIDISGSMEGAIEAAKSHLGKFLQAFPPEKIHICVFNTVGREIELKAPTARGVSQALANFRAGGGTDYSAGVRALQHHKPKDGEDVLLMFIGDEGAPDFHVAVRNSGLNPVAFGFLKVASSFPERRFAVQNTAATLGIPCFMIDEKIFSDPYAIPQTISRLIASTPVGQAVTTSKVTPRQTLVDVILQTPLLEKPF